MICLFVLFLILERFIKLYAATLSTETERAEKLRRDNEKLREQLADKVYARAQRRAAGQTRVTLRRRPG